MSFTVEITANDDGSYMVSSEPEAQEQAEEGMQPGMQGGAPQAQAMAPAPDAGAPTTPAATEKAEGQTVKTVKDALTLALSALKNGGQLPDMQGQNDEFDKGFGGPSSEAAPQAGDELQ